MILDSAENYDDYDDYERSLTKETYTAYSLSSTGSYQPVICMRRKIKPGYYRAGFSNTGVIFAPMTVSTTELVRFADSPSDNVINEAKTFWPLKEKYQEMGEPHRRGILLHGPPGGGKTCAITFLVKDFIDKYKGMVMGFSCEVIEALKIFRVIEPDRKVLVIIEDIDTYCDSGDVNNYLLQFLDGGEDVSNMLIVATTNYPERLPDRLINRPSRFDRIEYIGFPNATDRQTYLKKKTKLTKDDIEKWVNDTNDFTLAHLKELYVAVHILNKDYEETLKRLHTMRQKTASSEQYEKQLRGLGLDKYGFETVNLRSPRVVQTSKN